jgi:16S rRNA (guanine527-N7)-methyltransferase
VSRCEGKGRRIVVKRKGRKGSKRPGRTGGDKGPVLRGKPAPRKEEGSSEPEVAPESARREAAGAPAGRPESEEIAEEIRSYGDSFERHTGLILREKTVRALVLYVTELFRWNERAALMSRGDESRVVERHVMDSLSLLAFFHETDGASLLDIGSGAGFPALPLKIAAPGMKVTMVESVHKKELFLKYVIQKLRLDGALVLGARAEEAPWRDFAPEGFDIVTSRATLGLAELAGTGSASIGRGGALVAYKGGRFESELEAAQGQIERSGLRLMAVWESPWGPGRLLAFRKQGA